MIDSNILLELYHVHGNLNYDNPNYNVVRFSNEAAVDYAGKIGQAPPATSNWQIQGMRLLTLEDMDTDLHEWASA